MALSALELHCVAMCRRARASWGRLGEALYACSSSARSVELATLLQEQAQAAQRQRDAMDQLFDLLEADREGQPAALLEAILGRAERAATQGSPSQLTDAILLETALQAQLVQVETLHLAGAWLRELGRQEEAEILAERERAARDLVPLLEAVAPELAVEVLEPGESEPRDERQPGPY